MYGVIALRTKWRKRLKATRAGLDSVALGNQRSVHFVVEGERDRQGKRRGRGRDTSDDIDPQETSQNSIAQYLAVV